MSEESRLFYTFEVPGPHGSYFLDPASAPPSAPLTSSQTNGREQGEIKWFDYESQPLPPGAVKQEWKAHIEAVTSKRAANRAKYLAARGGGPAKKPGRRGENRKKEKEEDDDDDDNDDGDDDEGGPIWAEHEKAPAGKVAKDPRPKKQKGAAEAAESSQGGGESASLRQTSLLSYFDRKV